MALKTGQIINNRYRIVKLLGQGGFGAVYRAWDINLNAPVALKENLAQSPESVRQFTTEARLLANLRHENLPYVVDHFSIPGQGQYLVMEFIEGQDLNSMLRGKSLTEKDVLPWISQVCDALTFLHKQTPPIIHRDIKPENIKITPQGLVKLVDFGIAKIYNPSQQTTLGARAVTQGFSPPEQYGGGGITDVRSDVYALGATLYAALTGEIPLESLQRQIGKSLTKPAQLNSAVSPRVEQVILKAMELDPNQRYQSMSDFKGALLAKGYIPPFVQVAPTEYASPVEARTAPAGIDQPLPTQARPVDDHFKADISYQAPPLPGVPAKRKRTSQWTGLAIGAVVAVCLLLGAGGAYGAYVLFFTEEATATPVVLAQVTATEPWLPTLIPTSTATVPIAASLTHTLIPTSVSTPTWTQIPSPSATATQNPKATWYPCTGIYASRLHVGDKAFISYDPPLPNRVRTQPNAESPIVGYLQVGEKMEIIGGPVCSNNWIWWQIRSLDTSLTGWTAEGDSAAYWLVPLP